MSTKMTNGETKTLYEMLGGKDAVDTAVDIFYEKVLADDRIKEFFTDINMERQRGKQKAFLIMAFGGPHNYCGNDMREGHAQLVARGLNDSHVDAVIELLSETLAELGVAPDLIKRVASIAESVRNEVLSR